MAGAEAAGDPPDRRRSRPACGPANGHAERSRCCAAPAVPGRTMRSWRWRSAEGADRPRPARQGAYRIRQPVRCRDDRADRLCVRLPRDEGLRHAADARRRFPVPPVLSRGARKVAQVDLAPGEPRQPRASSMSAWSAMSGRPSRHCCRGSSRKTDRTHLDDSLAHYRKARTESRQAGRKQRRRQDRSIRNTCRGWSARSRRRMRSSPAMSAPRRCGRRAI